MIRVYLVDDDPMVRRGLKFILQATDDIEVVGEAGSGAEAVSYTHLTLPTTPYV